MKRTLKRESKRSWNCWEGSGWGSTMCLGRIWNGLCRSFNRLWISIDKDCNGGPNMGYWNARGDVIITIVNDSVCWFGMPRHLRTPDVVMWAPIQSVLKH